MKIIQVIAFASVLASCSGDWDVEESSFANRAEVPKGYMWLPTWLPHTATNIHDTHNNDTGQQTITFTVPPDGIAPMIDGLRPVLAEHEVAARELIQERRWANVQSNVKPEAYYVCGSSSAGVLVVDRSRGRGLFAREVMWAFPPCREDV